MQNLALFLTSFLREHLTLIENSQTPNLRPQLTSALQYLVKISYVQNSGAPLRHRCCIHNCAFVRQTSAARPVQPRSLLSCSKFAGRAMADPRSPPYACRGVQGVPGLLEQVRARRVHGRAPVPQQHRPHHRRHVRLHHGCACYPIISLVDSRSIASTSAFSCGMCSFPEEMRGILASCRTRPRRASICSWALFSDGEHARP